MESIVGLLIPIGTLVMVIVVQISFWFPSPNRHQVTAGSVLSSPSKSDGGDLNSLEEKTKEERPSTTLSELSSIMTCRPVESKETFEPFAFTGSNRSNAPVAQSKATDRQVSLPNSNTDVEEEEEAEDLYKTNDKWRCACQNGFLPAGMLKTFGGAEAMMRLGTGQCYHKQV